MDLIAQLINAKKEDKDLQLDKYLTELIKYEKLSKSKKFTHITDSPILQKQLPLCWSAFNRDAHSFWILNEASIILQNTTVNRLQIFDDLDSYYSKKKQRQMKIIENTNHHQFSYVSLASLPKNFNYDNALYLTETTDIDNQISLTIIQTLGNQTKVYSGTINIKDEEQIENEKYVIPPFTYSKDGDKITIKTYSVQGNNDYNFAELNDYFVSIPEYGNFCYLNKKTNMQTVIKLSESDIQTLNFYKNDLNKIAELIFKYKMQINEDDNNEIK